MSYLRRSIAPGSPCAEISFIDNAGVSQVSTECPITCFETIERRPTGKSLSHLPYGLSGASDGMVKLWNVYTGTLVALVAQHPGVVLGIAYISLPSRLLVGSMCDRGVVSVMEMEDYGHTLGSPNLLRSFEVPRKVTDDHPAPEPLTGGPARKLIAWAAGPRPSLILAALGGLHVYPLEALRARTGGSVADSIHRRSIAPSEYAGGDLWQLSFTGFSLSTEMTPGVFGTERPWSTADIDLTDVWQAHQLPGTHPFQVPLGLPKDQTFTAVAPLPTLSVPLARSVRPTLEFHGDRSSPVHRVIESLVSQEGSEMSGWVLVRPEAAEECEDATVYYILPILSEGDKPFLIELDASGVRVLRSPPTPSIKLGANYSSHPTWQAEPLPPGSSPLRPPAGPALFSALGWVALGPSAPVTLQPILRLDPPVARRYRDGFFRPGITVPPTAPRPSGPWALPRARAVLVCEEFRCLKLAPTSVLPLSQDTGRAPWESHFLVSCFALDPPEEDAEGAPLWVIGSPAVKGDVGTFISHGPRVLGNHHRGVTMSMRDEGIDLNAFFSAAPTQSPQPPPLPPLRATPVAIALHPIHDSILLIACLSGQIRIVDLATATCVIAYDGLCPDPTLRVKTAVWVEEGRRILLGTNFGSFIILNYGQTPERITSISLAPPNEESDSSDPNSSEPKIGRFYGGSPSLSIEGRPAFQRGCLVAEQMEWSGWLSAMPWDPAWNKKWRQALMGTKGNALSTGSYGPPHATLCRGCFDYLQKRGGLYGVGAGQARTTASSALYQVFHTAFLDRLAEEDAPLRVPLELAGMPPVDWVYQPPGPSEGCLWCSFLGDEEFCVAFGLGLLQATARADARPLPPLMRADPGRAALEPSSKAPLRQHEVASHADVHEWRKSVLKEHVARVQFIATLGEGDTFLLENAVEQHLDREPRDYFLAGGPYYQGVQATDPSVLLLGASPFLPTPDVYLDAVYELALKRSSLNEDVRKRSLPTYLSCLLSFAEPSGPMKPRANTAHLLDYLRRAESELSIDPFATRPAFAKEPGGDPKPILVPLYPSGGGVVYEPLSDRSAHIQGELIRLARAELAGDLPPPPAAPPGVPPRRAPEEVETGTVPRQSWLHVQPGRNRPLVPAPRLARPPPAAARAAHVNLRGLDRVITAVGEWTEDSSEDPDYADPDAGTRRPPRTDRFVMESSDSTEDDAFSLDEEDSSPRSQRRRDAQDSDENSELQAIRASRELSARANPRVRGLAEREEKVREERSLLEEAREAAGAASRAARAGGGAQGGAAGQREPGDEDGSAVEGAAAADARGARRARRSIAVRAESEAEYEDDDTSADEPVVPMETREQRLARRHAACASSAESSSDEEVPDPGLYDFSEDGSSSSEECAPPQRPQRARSRMVKEGRPKKREMPQRAARNNIKPLLFDSSD